MNDAREPCTYILASQRHGTLYIAVTGNLIRRLAQHRGGEPPGFTNPITSIGWSITKCSATGGRGSRGENQLKNWLRDRHVALIETTGPDWHDLAPRLGFDPIWAGV